MSAANSSTGSPCSARSANTSQTTSRRRCRTATLTACGGGIEAGYSPLSLIIVLAAALPRGGVLRVRIAPAKGAEKVVPSATARDAEIVLAPAHRKTALRLIVQYHDELRAIVSLAVQGLVRNDERGSRQCGRRDAVEHILRDGDAVERGPGVVPVIDRDRRPAQTSVGVRHRREHMRADRLVGIADRDRHLEAHLHAAPHIEPLRRAADEERDRLEHEFCLTRRLGGLGPLSLRRLGGVLRRRGGVELRLRVGL